MKDVKDIIIVGAGPAGLFCASQLKHKDFLLIEGGNSLNARLDAVAKGSGKDLVFGEGGAGLFSDGKINISQQIGGRIGDVLSEESYQELKGLFLKRYNLVEKCGASPNFGVEGLQCLMFPQHHFGTENLPGLISELKSAFSEKIICGTEIHDLDCVDGIFELTSLKGNKFRAKKVVIATGQGAFEFSEKIAKKMGIEVETSRMSVGFRIETENRELKKYFEIQYDPKILIKTNKGIVRTFCSNPQGQIVFEEKGGFYSVNGHAKKGSKSKFSNFALLIETKNRTDVLDACKQISKKNSGAAIQSLKAFLGDPTQEFPKSSHSSLSRDNFENYFSEEIVDGLREGTKKMLEVFPGLKSAVLYFPEVKFFPNKLPVTQNTFESPIRGLYFTGDCCGHIHGLYNAILSGLSCGRELN